VADSGQGTTGRAPTSARHLLDAISCRRPDTADRSYGIRSATPGAPGGTVASRRSNHLKGTVALPRRASVLRFSLGSTAPARTPRCRWQAPLAHDPLRVNGVHRANGFLGGGNGRRVTDNASTPIPSRRPRSWLIPSGWFFVKVFFG